MGTVNMAVDFGGVKMQNPINTAAGTFGYGWQFQNFFDVSQLGAITTKGCAAEPWPGNPAPRMAEIPGGMINSVGLQNPGVAAFAREDLIVTAQPRPLHKPRACNGLFSRSLKLREISAAGCNACEADTNVLGTLVYDLGKFGINFVASPRHADGILVTGPVSRNMREAVLATWAAVPEPRIAIAVGSCAISGGLFADSDECCGGLPPLCDVQLFVPGCPPSPWSILDGLLRLKSEKDVL